MRASSRTPGRRASLAPVLALACIWTSPDVAPARAADPLIVDDGATLARIEDEGLGLSEVVGPRRLGVIQRTVAADIAEFTLGARPDNPRRPFQPSWIERGRFELVGVVNRIDRRRFDPSSCGEVRLVYRLTLQNPGRPATRLPMTINVRSPQPKPDGDPDCHRVAARWLDGHAITSLWPGVSSASTLEINYQSIHVPASRTDMDDTAEYVLRAFAVEGDSLRAAPLFNTPRPDLDLASRRELADWAVAHAREIDRGVSVVPEKFLAVRSVSVSPRGLTRPENRPFTRALGDVRAVLAKVPFADLELARTPELFARRLDEATCSPCHQTRGVAGFHLLGETRSPSATFDALAVGHSPNLSADLAWRRADLASAARGEPPPNRPFAAAPDGAIGSECGLREGLFAWGCRPGLRCRDVHHADVGVCVPDAATGPGLPCEDVTSSPNARAEGPVVTALAADAACPAPTPSVRGPFCAPNWLGFTGGMCSELCAIPGEIRGSSICAPLPAAGYEADCFLSREPIERCLPRHTVVAAIAKCDRTTSCRDDYGCARIPGAPPSVGGCVPPYFLFQARVDGPLLDR